MGVTMILSGKKCHVYITVMSGVATIEVVRQLPGGYNNGSIILLATS